MISEKVELLGKGLYKDIPDQLTLQALPTASELDYVSADDFRHVMLDEILPKAIKEDINPYNLLEIDYYWICRCLRLLNYGPYHTVPKIYCNTCGVVSGEARIDLRSIPCRTLPEGFNNDIVISKDEFIDYKKDVHLKLLTVQQAIDAENDKMFHKDGKVANSQFARTCHMIWKVGNETEMNSIVAKTIIEDELSPADYRVLQERVMDLTDYGLRVGSTVQCPRCKGEAAFIVMVDDKFFRPTLGDIRAGKDQRYINGKDA